MTNFIEGKTKVTVYIKGLAPMDLEGSFEDVADSVWTVSKGMQPEAYTLYGGVELSMNPKSEHKTLVTPQIPPDIQNKMITLAEEDPEVFAQIQLARHLGMMPR